MQEPPPEESSRSSWETTSNDGTWESNQRRIEELKGQLAKEKSTRQGLEARINKLEAIVSRITEERRKWEMESSEKVTPEDLLDGKNNEWQEIFNNLKKRLQEYVKEKIELEIQLDKANQTIKRLQRDINTLNEKLEKSQKEVGELKAEIQRNAEIGDSDRTGSQNEQQD